MRKDFDQESEKECEKESALESDENLGKVSSENGSAIDSEKNSEPDAVKDTESEPTRAEKLKETEGIKEPDAYADSPGDRLSKDPSREKDNSPTEDSSNKKAPKTASVLHKKRLRVRKIRDINTGKVRTFAPPKPSMLRRLLPALLTAAVLIGFAWLLFGLQWLTWMETAVRVCLPIWIIISIFLCLALFALAFKHTKRASALAILGIPVALAYFFMAHTYLVDHTYSKLAVTDPKTQTSFQDRTPWVIANNYASRDQGDDIGDRGNVKHVPVSKMDASAASEKQTDTNKKSRYTTLITGRSVIGNVGYTSVRQFDLPKSGSLDKSESNSCPMPAHMGKRLGALLPWRSLDREISILSPFSHFNYDDAYGYCDGEKPVVVQPLYRYVGLWIVMKQYAGAAVYTPQGLEIMSPQQLQESGIEGPTMPLSVVRTVRESLTASGTYADWWGQRAGYDTTEKDKEDANTENASEFSLLTSDGKLRYVTPLTPRGSSQSIVATMIVPAQQSPGLLRNMARLETTVDLPATSSLENAIRSASVPSDPQWATRWAAGMKVYEIVPTHDGSWVASIGLGQEVNYRAHISSNGTVSVSNEDKLLGKDSATAGSGSEAGGSQTGALPGDSRILQPLTSNLSALTKEQLADLITRAAAELAARN